MPVLMQALAAARAGNKGSRPMTAQGMAAARVTAAAVAALANSR